MVDKPTRPSRRSTRPPLKPAPNGIVYLSGGNPQIPKGDGDAPVQAYIDAMPEWKRDAGRRLDQLIVQAVPNVRKAVRWNSPFYGTEERGWFVSYHVFAKYIKLTFLNGVLLDPMPPAGGKDPDARWIDLYEGDFDTQDGLNTKNSDNIQRGDNTENGIDEAQLTDWFRQSASHPAWKGF